nr:hypothetical protein DM860_009625 [Ipomoea batatas]
MSRLLAPCSEFMILKMKGQISLENMACGNAIQICILSEILCTLLERVITLETGFMLMLPGTLKMVHMEQPLGVLCLTLKV